MYNIDKKMLNYLHSCTEKEVIRYGSDTYHCGGYKCLGKEKLSTRIVRVSEWVKRNGGQFEVKSDWICVDGNNYTKVVRIIFPTYGKRNMKEIMSTLFYK